MRGPKQKLTLSVEAGIVDQAKRLGVNISELTEQVLRGYALKDEGLDGAAYRQRYLEFLKTMDPLLSKYGASVVVGDLFAKPGIKNKQFESEIRYCGAGGFSIDLVEDFLTIDQLEGPEYSVGLRNPGHVLRNLVSELENAKIRRKEQVANLLIAGRIVEAIYRAEAGTSDTLPKHGFPDPGSPRISSKNRGMGTSASRRSSSRNRERK